MIKILVTGANGQLGQKIRDSESLIPEAVFLHTDIDSLNINSQITIKDYFATNNIDILINCAAYTAVDNAEDDYESALTTNSVAVKNLAEASIKYDFKIIHISTDYVFNGESNKPLNEEDKENPINNYGKSKLEGEKQLLNVNPDAIIIRTSWLYSEYGSNFLKTMLKLANEIDSLKVVYDQVGTPTYAGDLAEAIVNICKNKVWTPGIYHYSNLGVCSWYDFANEIFSNCDKKIKLIPVLSSAFPAKAKRPYYSVLDKSKIANTYNLNIPYWTDSVSKCLNLIK